MNGWEEATAVGARLTVGAILLVAGWAKLRAGSRLFRDAVLAYDLVPRWAARALAAALPVLELLAGASLLLGLATLVGAGLAFVLIGVVSAAVAISLARGKRHFCGCLGFTGDDVRLIQWSIVYRNLALMAALLLATGAGDRWRVDAWLGWGEATLSAGWLRAGWLAWAAGVALVLLVRTTRPAEPATAGSETAAT